jgi:hypothetical protein
MSKPFWMVFGLEAPYVRHDSEDTARKEAERLARKYTLHEFVVMRAVAVVKKTDVAWSECTDSADDVQPL